MNRNVDFVKRKTIDTSIEGVDAFFADIFKHHGLQESIVANKGNKFPSDFRKRLMEF